MMADLIELDTRFGIVVALCIICLSLGFAIYVTKRDSRDNDARACTRSGSRASAGHHL